MRDSRKYISVKPPGGDHFIRLYRLGKGIRRRASKPAWPGAGRYRLHRRPICLLSPTPQTLYRPGWVHPRPPRQKAHGFRALYLYYLYLLGGPRTKQRCLPFSTRKEAIRLRQYQRQARLLREYHIDTRDQLSILAGALQAEMDALAEQREGAVPAPAAGL